MVGLCHRKDVMFASAALCLQDAQHVDDLPCLYDIRGISTLCLDACAFPRSPFVPAQKQALFRCSKIAPGIPRSRACATSCLMLMDILDLRCPGTRRPGKGSSHPYLATWVPCHK